MKPFDADAIIERAKEACGARSDAELGRKIDKPGKVISNWRYRQAVPMDDLNQIADLSGASLHWLLKGEGARQVAPLGSATAEVSAPTYGQRDVLEAADRQRISRLQDYVLVPRYDVRAMAGHGALVESEQVVDHLAFRLDWLAGLGLQQHGALALVSLAGDSMEPTLVHGDLLLVHTARYLVAGDGIYVLRRDHELIAKRCQRLRDGSVRVSSDNAAYAVEVYPMDEQDALNVLGRVVWMGRTL